MAERYYLQGPNKALPRNLRQKFLFDANVWLSISGPFPDEKVDRASAYSSFYNAVAKAEGTVILPQLILAEFVNRAVMIQAGVAKFQKGRGVKIHHADEYGDWIKEACDLSHHIAEDNERVADEFDALDLPECLAAAEQGGLEFHDVLLAQACLRNDYILVTDDADFSGQDIAIVTWNTRLT